MSVILETTLGDIVIDLFTNERPRGKKPGRGKKTLSSVFVVVVVVVR